MEAYPRLGISIDFLQLGAAKAEVDGLKVSILELGAVAEKPIGAGGAAVVAQTREASAAVQAGAAEQIGAYERVASAQLAMAERMSGAMTQIAVQQRGRDTGLVQSARSAATARASAFGAGFEAEVQAALAAAGQISALDAQRLRTSMEETETRAVLERSLRRDQVIGAQRAAAEQIGSAEAQSAAEIASFERTLAASRGALTSRMALTRQQASEAAAEAKAAAAAQVAADQQAQASAEAALAFRMRLTRQMNLEAAADAKTAAAAQVAADREAEASAQAAFAFRMQLTRQRFAQETAAAENAARAEALNAENTYVVAKAHLAAAAGTDAETAAIEALTLATANLARVRGGAAGAKATSIGADAGLASDAATVGLLASTGRASSAAATEGERFVKSLERQAATLGLTRIQLLEFRAAELGVAEAAGPMIASMKAAEAAGSHSGGIFGLSSQAMRESLVLIREFSRGDFTRMAGSFSLLLQYTGQLTKALSILFNPVTAVVGALLAMAFAMEKGSEEQAKLNNALQVTGGFAGVTAGQFEAMAQRIASANDVGLGRVNKAMLELVSSGKVGGDALGYIAEAAVKMSRLTGESTEAVAKKLESLATEPTKAIIALNEAHHFLTLQQYESIRALEEEGRVTDAATLASKTFKQWTDSTTVSSGFLEQALHGLAGAFGAVWNAAKNFGKTDTAEQLRDAAQGALDHLKTKQFPLTALPTGEVVGNARAEDYYRRQLAQANAAIGSAKDRADRQEVQDRGVKASQYFDSNNFGGSRQRADRAVEKDRGEVEALRAAQRVGFSRDREAQLDELDRTQAAREKLIRKRYDAIDQPKKQKHELGPDPGAAERPIEIAQNAIDALRSQLETISKFDLSPLADDAAKISRAYGDAFSKFSTSRNPFEKSRAGELAGLAAEKERLTFTVQLGDALLKQAAADNNRTQALDLATKGIAAQHAALDSYYAAGSQGSAQYASALQAQAKAGLDAQHAQDDLALAQRFGVEHVNQISDAYVESQKTVAEQLGLTGPARAKFLADVRAEGDSLQAAAKKALMFRDAVADLSDVQKAANALADFHSKTVADVADLQAEAAAYRAGADAIAAYARQKAIRTNLLGKVSANATPAERAAALAAVTADTDSAHLADLTSQEAKYQQQRSETLRIAGETADVREREARIADLINLYQAQNLSLTHAEARARAEITSQLEKQVEEAAALGQKISDSIRQGFVETGKLDFSSLQKGIGEAIRKAVYDQLLAKPINMVVNAAVNFQTQLMQKAIDQIIGSVGSGGTSGILGQLTGLLRIGTGGGQYKSDPNLDAALNDLGGSFSKVTSQLSAGISKAASSFGQAAAGFSIGQSVDAMFGIKQGIGTTVGGVIGAGIGMAIGGPIGSAIGSAIGGAIGSIFNGKPSNEATVLGLDASGGVVSVGGGKRTEQTTQAANSAAQGIAQVEAALRQAGATLTTTVSSIDLGMRDTTHIMFTGGQRIETAVGDAKDAVKQASLTILQGARFSNEQLQSVVSGMVSAGASIDEVVKKIDEFGQAQTFVRDAAVGPLQFTDPLAFQLAGLAANQNARQTALDQYRKDGVLTDAQAATTQANITKLNGLEVQNALDNFTSSVNGASHSLRDFKDAQQKVLDYARSLSTGSLSPLSPQEQLAQDRQNYQAQFAKAKAGDYDALSAITGTAQTYLEAAQKFYASGPDYASLFTGVQGDLTDLGSQKADDPMQAQLKLSTADLVAALGDNAKTIVTAIYAQGRLTATPTTVAPVVASNDLVTPGQASNDDIVAELQRLQQTVAGSGQYVADMTVWSNQGVGAAVNSAAATQSALQGGLLTSSPVSVSFGGSGIMN